MKLTNETVEFLLAKKWWELLQKYYEPVNMNQDEEGADIYWQNLMIEADALYNEVKATGNESATIMAEELVMATVKTLRKKSEKNQVKVL